MKFLLGVCILIFCGNELALKADGSFSSSAENAGLPGESVFTVDPGQEKQTIKGLGFEIQCDSIGSGNHGLPDAMVGVPHDLVASERQRLAREMLKGFRYCRLAGGLYWRGLDARQKFLRPRWPEQLTELHDLLSAAGVEGVSFEYWSPPPFWKGNHAYVGKRPHDPANRLRCFAPGFAKDPIYHGDTNRFLGDFSQAVVTDMQTLKSAGIEPVLWGLQNEPDVNHEIYSTCEYPDSASYVRTYEVVAAALRKSFPYIGLFADTADHFPSRIAPGMSDARVASLVDYYAVHITGSPSETPGQVAAKITAELPARPWFQNEYEYLTGEATPDRCLNTVQHIMNSFQLAQNPTWFWLHILKPVQNAEASGYSLGFWKSRLDTNLPPSVQTFRRWPAGPEFTALPEALKKLEMVSVKAPAGGKSAIGYNFIVNQPVIIYLLADARMTEKLPAAWQKTKMTAAWSGGSDTIYRRTFSTGKIEIPAPGGVAVAHSVFIEPSDQPTFVPQIGMNLPLQIRSQALALEQKAVAVEPGHWIFNNYNWFAVGSFTRHVPWDSVVVAVAEQNYDANARVLAFRRPGGKLTIAISNRNLNVHGFHIDTGLMNVTFRAYRYAPGEAGKNCAGIELGSASGGIISPRLPGLSWEFWEEQ